MTDQSARSEPIYLDFAASAPPAEEVVDAMLPWLRGQHANPHADHWHGQRAARAVEEARAAIATLIGGDPDGVVFTSGATEANNLALKGLLSLHRTRLWLSGVEHKSLLEPARALNRDGTEVNMLEVDDQGHVLPSALADKLAMDDRRPGLVAVGHGNNEIGTVQDIAALAGIAHEYGHYLHVDASQTAGHISLSVIDDEIDLLCLSSHKMYGPAGIGALYVDPRILPELRPLLHGGGQEQGLRSGTVAPFLAVGFGKAAELARRTADQHRLHLECLARTFLDALDTQGLAYTVLGDPVRRLPGHVSIRIPGVEADDVLGRLLPWLSASSGAACASGELRASHVLRALGLDETQASQVIRFSFGRPSQLEQAEEAGKRLVNVVGRVQAQATSDSTTALSRVGMT
ncbi:cysteine desulfurase family protein [Xanthomonas sp. CFBP 8445]|uniref:cysteine desulfurase family protein n=1 Tax=Xanthomonas sp. CFBP 8445 TaxID=2971236 RepID=UPI0021E01040|nr:cysteine desulfurase family protein [Xanthomonas sp. CFBP 8445]UYC14039.1 cysteine desulfurase [Xanthomonas sp. CFBP 8445]